MHHGAGLRDLTGDEALVEALSRDYRRAQLASGDRVMLDYVAKLTVEPASMERADVEALRRAGFGDAAILDVNQVASYYAFVNRLADGLGIELEPWKDDAGLGGGGG